MAPLILTAYGDYVVAAHIETFFHCESSDRKDLYCRMKSGAECCVILATTPAKEAWLFRSLGLSMVYADAAVSDTEQQK